MPSYTAAERHQLESALASGEELACPACGGAVQRQPVVPPTTVSYVRHRVWLLCQVCRRSGAVDVRGVERP